MLKTIIALTALTVCATASPALAGSQSGIASWYGPDFHGNRTASGVRFNAHAMTAAHRTLPFGTMVTVTCRETKKSVVVEINDRGPFTGKVIDLSFGAARQLGLNPNWNLRTGECSNAQLSW